MKPPRALRRGTTAVDDVMNDVRDAMGTVRNSVGTVASVVSAPRAALAFGLWRGIQFWRKRRAAQRVAATPQTSGVRNYDALEKETGNDTVERKNQRAAACFCSALWPARWWVPASRC